jgi:hypothetical protein
MRRAVSQRHGTRPPGGGRVPRGTWLRPGRGPRPDCAPGGTRLRMKDAAGGRDGAPRRGPCPRPFHVEHPVRSCLRTEAGGVQPPPPGEPWPPRSNPPPVPRGTLPPPRTGNRMHGRGLLFLPRNRGERPPASLSRRAFREPRGPGMSPGVFHVERLAPFSLRTAEPEAGWKGEGSRGEEGASCSTWNFPTSLMRRNRRRGGEWREGGVQARVPCSTWNVRIRLPGASVRGPREWGGSCPWAGGAAFGPGACSTWNVPGAPPHRVPRGTARRRSPVSPRPIRPAPRVRSGRGVPRGPGRWGASTGPRGFSGPRERNPPSAVFHVEQASGAASGCSTWNLPLGPSPGLRDAPASPPSGAPAGPGSMSGGRVRG